MYVFFSVPNWPKIGIFLGLGSAQLSPPPPHHIFPGVPTLGYCYMCCMYVHCTEYCSFNIINNSVCEVSIVGKISDCQPEGPGFNPWPG